jgi:1,4-alpha-glucan branching enzyme
MVCHAFYPSIGGVEQHVMSLARELIITGSEVVVITRAINLKRSWGILPKTAIRYRRREKIHGIKVIRCWLFIEFALYLFKESRNSDIIHLHGPFVPYPEVLRFVGVRSSIFNVLKPIRVLYRKPVVTTMHGLHVRLNDKRSSMDEMALECADLIIAVDSEMYSDLRSMQRTNVTFIPNGVRLEKLVTLKQRMMDAELRDHFEIICPRRIDPKNGIEYSLLALKEIVLKKEYSVRMSITGPSYGDSYERRIIRLSQEPQLKGRVRIYNGFEHSKLIKLIQDSDIAVFPSLWESTSIAALECLSCGVPVVAFDTGGLRDIVTHGFNGFLAPQKDHGKMAEYIGMILDSSTLRMKMSENAFLSAKAFSWERIYRRTLNAYLDAFHNSTQSARKSR